MSGSPIAHGARRRPIASARSHAIHIVARAVVTVLLIAGGSAAPTLLRAADLPDENARFGQLTIEDGLSHTWVQAILKDSRGFLWFGTQDGLNRYDGTGFKVYRNDPNDPHSIPSNVAGVLFEDSQKRLWIGSAWGSTGVALYDPMLDRFTGFMPRPGEASGNSVRAIIEDANGMLWLGTDNGIARLDPGTGAIQRYPILPEDQAGQPEAQVASLYEDSRQRIWVGGSAGLLRFDRAKGTYERWPGNADDANGLHRAEVWDFYEDRQGRLWIGTLGSGLHYLDPDTGRDVRYLPDPARPDSIGNARVRRIIPDGQGRLYLGLENAGLDVMDLGTGRFRHFLPDIDDETSISSNSIWDLYLDDQGTLWIGTFNGGVNILSPHLQRFRLMRAGRGRLSDPHVASVLEDRRGTLWVGTDGGGLDRVDPGTGRFTYYRHNPDDPTTIGSDAVWALLEDSRGNFWLGGWAGGLGLLDRATGRVTRYRHDPNDPASLVSDHIWRVLELRTGELLVVTQQGADLFDRDTGRFRRLRSLYPEAGDGALYAAAEDAQGGLWLAGDTFVGYIDRRNATVTRFRHDPEDSESLGRGWAQAVFIDSRGTVWLGTEGGLSAYEPKSGTWHRYTVEDGLSHNSILGIAEDDQGHLWVSTGRGLCKMIGAVGLPDKPKILSFDVHDGLQGREFARNACFRSATGRLYFGGSRGLNSFLPRDVVENPEPPTVVLTDLRIRNEPVRPGADGSPLDVAIGETRRLTLSPDDTMVTFEFAALSYVIPKKNKFKYRLDPFETQWNEAGQQNTATYTYLPRGKEFTFRVAASNNDGVWNEDGVALAVYVTPRWYERWITWIVVAAALLTAAAGGHRVRVAALRARESELASRVDEQTADLQKEIREHQRTEMRLAEENEERQRAEEKTRQAAERLKEGNAQLLEQREALQRENQERRKAEEAAGRERDLLRALIDNIPDQIYFKDRESRFVRVNAALAEAVGSSGAEAMVGKSDRDFFTMDLAAATFEEEQGLMRSGEATVGKLQHDTRGGRWYLATKVPIRGADGVVTGLVGISKDITERKIAEDRLEENLRTYLEVVSAVAQGDLTRRGTEGEETLGRIARSVNGMLEGFAGILGEVRDAAFAVSSSSSEILATATQIAKGAQYGSDQVESTLAAVEEMAASMSQVAKNAENSSEKTRLVLEHVRRGDEAANVTNAGMARIDSAATETAEKMRMLEKRSTEIFEIIGLIEDLASQSALLSLNAAIEAAHAGEAGRGFAVVADEVRRLADRSKEATMRVAGIVEAMVEEVQGALAAMEHAVGEVKEGRALSAQAIASLAEISSLVRDSAGLTEQISGAAREQASVTSTVVGSMQTIANVTHESAAGATSTTTAVQDLVRLSEQLTSAIARFRIDGGRP